MLLSGRPTPRLLAGACAGAALLVAPMACRKESARKTVPIAEGQQASPPTPGDVTSDSARTLSLVEMYRDGVYGVSDGLCTLAAPQAPGPRLFECGVLLMKLRPGLEPESIADLLTTLSASVMQGPRTYWNPTYIRISVPRGTERAAILRALADNRVEIVELNWARTFSR